MRILRLEKRGFSSKAAWGFAVLGLSMTRGGAPDDAAAVQKAYRGLMRKFHPDRAGSSKSAADALVCVHEAKGICELATSNREPPGPPLNPRGLMFVGASSGCRRLGLTWEAPARGEHDSVAPVTRYVVAAFDPAYGRTVTVAVLEPDYSEKLSRFVPINELRNYILVEAELGKLANLFRQRVVTVQVAAANETGQSAWATLQVPTDAPASSSSPPKPGSIAATATFGSIPRAARRSAGGNRQERVT